MNVRNREYEKQNGDKKKYEISHQTSEIVIGLAS